MAEQFIVKVKYWSEEKQGLSPQEYTYFSVDPLKVGDVIEVPVRDRMTKALVTTINVPEAEIEALKEIAEKAVEMAKAEDLNKFASSTFQAVMRENEHFDPTPGTDLEVQNWHTQALSLKDYAEKRVIKSVEDIKFATDDLAIIAHLKKAMEERRKEYVKPLQEQVKSINDKYKELMEPVEAADKITRDKILIYKHEQERIRQEQEAINRLREEAAQKQKELTGEITEVEKVEVVAEPPKRVSTEMGTSGTMKVRKWRLVDITKVPSEYLLVDAGKVTKLVKAGIGEIQGIEIYEEESLRMTPSRY